MQKTNLTYTMLLLNIPYLIPETQKFLSCLSMKVECMAKIRIISTSEVWALFP